MNVIIPARPVLKLQIVIVARVELQVKANTQCASCARLSGARHP